MEWNLSTNGGSHGGHLGMLTGTNADDYLVHHRDPDMQNHAGTGLTGFDGNDTLEASVSNMGQIHMFGGMGDDYLILDVTKIPDAGGTQGHHAYGGTGADTFDFVNIADNHSPIVGRLDNFDPTIDTIRIEGVEIDLADLPMTITLESGEEVFVRVIKIEHPEFAEEELGTQQFLAIGDNIFYALEGARDLSNGVSGLTGEERHFLHPDALDELRSAEAIAYSNPHNFVPHDYYKDREDELELVWAPSGAEVKVSSSPDNSVHIYAGKKNQDAPSSKGAQEIRTGSGNDVIDANTGNDTIFSGSGHDLVAGGIDNDLIFGERGDDTLWGGDGNDTVNGGAGSDRLYGNNGSDTLDGGRGHDRLFGGDGSDYLRGRSGNDVLKGGADNDLLGGGRGNDKVFGGSGHDTVIGGHGQDRLSGGSGNDIIKGGTGSDRLYGNRGNDTLHGGSGKDILKGGSGDDTLDGGRGHDRLFGGDGSDYLRGRSGNDVLKGGADNDLLGGGDGNDRIHGGTGDDRSFGGKGNDTLFGGAGDDFIGGGGGDDRIVGGRGNDTVRGSDGADTFVFRDGDDTLLIEDFRFAHEDILELDSDLWADTAGALSVDQVLSIYGEIIDGDLILDFGAETVVVQGVDRLTDFSESIVIV